MNKPLPPTGSSLRPDRAHEPVLVTDVVAHLKLTEATFVVDATLGLGGHSAQILDANPQVKVIGIDRDPGALKLASERLASYGSRLTTRHGNFAELLTLIPKAAHGKVDAILMDLGLSSWQLAERGFSFQTEAPLDFRLDPDDERTAADIVNEASEGELADLLYQYGEERRSRRIAKAIVDSAKEAPIDTTQRLAKVIQSAAHRQGRLHPATKSFQALRIAVNDELGSLQRGLAAAEQILAPGGRLLVISFHSLEDRLVKEFINTSKSLRKVNKKVIQASREESQRNPRARSAKLRVAEKASNSKGLADYGRTKRSEAAPSSLRG